MLTIQLKKKAKRNATKIVYPFRKLPKEMILKEDPIEVIIRVVAKPISLKKNVKWSSEDGRFIYHPSHAYFEYLSKMYPLSSK